MFARFICRIIGHRRSRRWAHVVQGQWHSRCKVCGTALVRKGHSDWRETRDAA